MRHSCKFALIVHWNAKIQAPSGTFHIKIQVSVSRFSAKFQDSYQDTAADFSYSSTFQDVFPDPGRRSKK